MRLRYVAALLVLSATVSLHAQDDRYILSASDGAGMLGDAVGITVDLDLVPGAAGVPRRLQGWSYGLCHDSTALSLVDVVNGFSTATVGNGNIPACNSIYLDTDGFTIGVVVSLFGAFHLQVGTDRQLNVATYEPLTVGMTPLDFCNTLATPPVETLVVEIGGQSRIPVQQGGSVTAVAGGPTQFLRGDVNGDGVLNLSDGLFQLEWFFGVGASGTCREAADTNGNGRLDTLADPLLLFYYLFASGPAPATPFPNCGSPVLFVGCESYTACP